VLDVVIFMTGWLGLLVAESDKNAPIYHGVEF
jgi:hypothetical protein